MAFRTRFDAVRDHFVTTVARSNKVKVQGNGEKPDKIRLCAKYADVAQG
jgi:hypothetical protein